MDTNLYIKGFSGAMVYQALYGILGAFGVFTILYLSVGSLAGVIIAGTGIVLHLMRLVKIQKKFGAKGLVRKREATMLPEFMIIKRPVMYTTIKISEFKTRDHVR